MADARTESVHHPTGKRGHQANAFNGGARPWIAPSGDRSVGVSPGITTLGIREGDPASPVTASGVGGRQSTVSVARPSAWACSTFWDSPASPGDSAFRARDWAGVTAFNAKSPTSKITHGGNFERNVLRSKSIIGLSRNSGAGGNCQMIDSGRGMRSFSVRPPWQSGWGKRQSLQIQKSNLNNRQLSIALPKSMRAILFQNTSTANLPISR